MRSGWIIPIATYVLLFVIYLYFFGSDVKPGELMQIMLLLALVGVTVFYAWSAHRQAEASLKMAEEMMEQRYDTVLPIIDIQEQASGTETIKQGLDAASGQLPKAMPCILRNIGLGVATDVYSLVETPDGQCLQYDFGTVASTDKTREMRLFLEQRGDRSALVVYYQDVYGRPLESSREVSVDKEAPNLNIGPLRFCKRPKP